MTRGFAGVTGVMAVMPRANINTDAIIPAAWLRTATADFGRGLFGGLRYEADGVTERPDFVLNQPPFRTARILLADENFGCGSSREAAVWALAGFGIRAVLAPSFADIFYENAFRNGLLAAQVDARTFQALATLATHAENPVFTIDLPRRIIAGPGGLRYAFEVPPARAEALIRGDDEIDMTLRHLADIDAYHAAARQQHSWLHTGLEGMPS
jgi:3-isopropylmalate dehydratase small subunit